MKKNNAVSKGFKTQGSNFHVGNSPAVPMVYAANQRVADRAAQKAISAKPKKFKSGGW